VSGWQSFVAALCVGVACAMLQPKQPQSVIATALLMVALYMVAYP
jgi:hypothetical protein